MIYNNTIILEYPLKRSLRKEIYLTWSFSYIITWKYENEKGIVYNCKNL